MSKVCGENLVSVGFLGFPRLTYLLESVGDPGTTRTCDPLLRRPKTAFLTHSCNSKKSRQNLISSREIKKSLGLAKYSRASHKGEVSGEQLVNFSHSAQLNNYSQNWLDGLSQIISKDRIYESI